MDQLEQMPLIRSNDIHALEKFADLVRITVVKLQAEGKDGELGDETLHNEYDSVGVSALQLVMVTTGTPSHGTAGRLSSST